MTAPLLPHDILREISMHWAGHALAYTCTALYASWSPDRYVVTESKGFVETMANSDKIIINITTTRMPNGVHHGRSIVTNYYSADGSIRTEIIEYNQGNILFVTCQTPQTYSRDIVIDGWVATWTSEVPPLDTADMLGSVWIEYECLRADVPFCDFVTVAREMIALMQPSKTAAIVLMLFWDGPMPGTRQF